MTPIELNSFPDSHALTAAVARQWKDLLAARTGQPLFSVALSGGRIMPALFRAMIAESRGISWSSVLFFFADERCVPPNHPDSNFLQAQQHLFTPAGIAPEQVCRMRGELPPADGARQAEGDIRARLAVPPGAMPQLDLVFLGMGEDGHTASLFPGSAPDGSAAVCRAVVGPKPPPNRLTLTYEALAAARNVWVIASGSGKEQALRDTLSGDTPLGKVLQMRQSAQVFTDIEKK